MGVAVGGAGVAADLVMRISELLLLTELFVIICIFLISNRYELIYSVLKNALEKDECIE